MAVVQAPTITTQINSNYFIEALGGAQPITSYLKRFPDSLYTKSIDSLLVIFLYGLLGPTGVGQLRKEYLEARLQIEESGLSTADLDSLYTNAFGFARLANETYQLDADSSLLPTAERAQILAQDSSFRNRAQYFLKGAKAGTTLLGVSMAARSGLNRPVEVVENWRQLFDRYSDAPLDLPLNGQTSFTNEIAVIPRQVKPTSSVQRLQITGNPVRGYFTLSFPPQQDWHALVVQTTANSSVITVPDISKFPAGVFVTVTSVPSTSNNINPYEAGWNYARFYGVSNGPYLGSSTQIQVINLSASIPFTGSYYAFVGYGQTSILPHDISAAALQNALSALPSIGSGNIMCSGGPLPNTPIDVHFINQLGNREISTLVSNLGPDVVVGINATGSGGTEQMSDINNSPLNISLNPTNSVMGVSIPGQATTISAQDQHSMLLAMDAIRPWTSFVTNQPGKAEMIEQESSMFAESTSVEVVRYVTGRSGIPWPAKDNRYWIESGVEHEAPKALDTKTHQYTGFHNIVSCISYTDGALSDSSYNRNNSTIPLSQRYWDSLVGSFSGDQMLLLPGLQSISGTQYQYLPSGAPAGYTEPLLITNVSGQGIINDIYPVDYLSLPGVSQSHTQTLWASIERAEGADYLEIDLGQTQAVNFISLQITSKPLSIEVAYDSLDQAPVRSFVNASIAPTTAGQSHVSVSYKSQVLWTNIQMYLTNHLGGMIFTRFIRIGFVRQPMGTPYALPLTNKQPQPSVPTSSLPLLVGNEQYVAPPLSTQFTIVPYSVEVQNLRIGRSVSASVDVHHTALTQGAIGYAYGGS